MTANDLAFCGVANLVHTDEVASTKSASYGLASGANEPGTRSSAGEHALHTGGVVGSIPTASTIRQPLSGVYFLFRRGVLTYSGKSKDVYSRLAGGLTKAPNKLITRPVHKNEPPAGSSRGRGCHPGLSSVSSKAANLGGMP